MARTALRIAENVPGDFFVDSTCIDCDACRRQIAPAVFHEIGDQSAVYHQPSNEEELLAAQRALISCPTASIGDVAKRDMKPAVASLPEWIHDDVYRCGYTSESSFGAVSWYVRDTKTLVDSPRFANPLVKNIEALGGVRLMLLTHQDVAERPRRLNAVHTIRALLGAKVLPVVNENDTVATAPSESPASTATLSGSPGTGSSDVAEAGSACTSSIS